MKTAGIYAIVHLASCKMYVGSSIDIAQRRNEHRRDLEQKKHRNRYLQAAWNKYGEDAFAFVILEPVEDTQRLLNVEQSYLDNIDKEMTYNLLPVAGSRLGVRHSEATKAKMSRSSRGRKHTEAAKARMRASHKGKVLSATHVANIMAAQKGRKHSAATRAKIGAAHKGQKRSAEARANMSAAQKASTYKATAESRAKMSASQTARWAARKCL